MKRLSSPIDTILISPLSWRDRALSLWRWTHVDDGSPKLSVLLGASDGLLYMDVGGFHGVFTVSLH